MFIPSTGAKNAKLGAATLRTAFDNGSIEFWDTSAGAPATADAAATATKIATGTLPTAGAGGAFAAPASGSMAKNGTWNFAGIAAAGAGTAIGYGRLKVNGGTDALNTTEIRYQFNVGIAGSTVAITGTPTVSGVVATITTGSAHGLAAGDMAMVAGNAGTGVNIKYQVLSAPSGTTLTVLVPVGATWGAGGTIRKAFDVEVDNINIANAQAGSVGTFTLNE